MRTFHLERMEIRATLFDTGRFLWTPFQNFSDLSGRFAAYFVALAFKLR